MNERERQDKSKGSGIKKDLEQSTFEGNMNSFPHHFQMPKVWVLSSLGRVAATSLPTCTVGCRESGDRIRDFPRQISVTVNSPIPAALSDSVNEQKVLFYVEILNNSP